MTESSSLAPLQLKKNEERRIRAGHLWVYSNEVDTVATPLSGFEPGQQVQLLAHNGKRLGNGYVNPNSLICARLVSRDPRYLLDRSLLVHRLNIALALRERLFDGPYYRLVYGEADQLPGLVIDRYGEVVTAAAQINEGNAADPASEGFDRFCSAYGFEKGTDGLLDDVFFTGRRPRTASTPSPSAMAALVRTRPARRQASAGRRP